MLNTIRQRFLESLVCLPDSLYHCAETVLKKSLTPQRLEMLRMERYALRLTDNFTQAWDEVLKNRKCMIITQGDYGYSYLNVAYLNNVMTLIFYALYHGCVPVIRINQDRQDYNKWDWYFLQPYVVMDTDITGFEEVPCDILNHDLRPDMQMIHTPENWKCKLFAMLFRRFIRLNPETKQYVEDEICNIGNPAKMLGVLMRGTDYIKLRPKGHPVQPEPEEIIARVADRFARGDLSAVYVATEEKRLYDMVGDAVGRENVRENKRQYYDELYYKSDEVLIGKVHFDRDNDNYWKGIEYLSSLIILSRCKTLVASNCGGTLFAALMGDYEAPEIFNYGVY